MNPNTSSDDAGDGNESPIYAVLVNGDEVTTIEVDHQSKILPQVSNEVPNAVPDLMLPGWRDIEIWSCLRWTEARIPIVMLALEHGLAIRPDLKINRKAWAAYGRSPVVGPVVIIHDSDVHGMPVPIPPNVIDDLRSDVPDELISAMIEALNDVEMVGRW